MPSRRTHSQSAQQSIGDAVLAYHAVQPSQDPNAETLLSDIMSRLHTEPVSELDVQNIWWTFQYVSDWHEWLNAMLYNIVRFDVLNMAPTGGYIELFIETEMLMYHERGVQQLLEMYERYKYVVMVEASARSTGPVRRVLCRAAYAGDQQHCLFELTKSQIANFNHKACRTDPDAATVNISNVSNTTNMFGNSRKRPSTGAAQGAYAALHPAIWEALKLPKPPAPSKKQQKAKTWAKVLQPDSNESFSDSGKTQDSSRPRMHNDPGLTDRRWPKVCLPQADTREVRTTLEDLAAVKDKKIDHDRLWPKTKSSLEFLFSRKKGEMRVVKLPSRA
ncbi:hypothetical protein EJ02DRAFT_431135 [Clathrospora elynae]|uniref:Uncharacterized protein n=1 Tax=Clathrospora elynae TaxID=706981 RepID=A0A6A5T0Z4_9PLEO|nr:hypothetical protein EJ02DRAFT_431135 [Clathrospora elynae]